MADYFTILKISIDPPETNPDKIREAIEKLEREARMLINNGGSKGKKLQAKCAEIRTALSDANAIRSYGEQERKKAIATATAMLGRQYTTIGSIPEIELEGISQRCGLKKDTLRDICKEMRYRVGTATTQQPMSKSNGAVPERSVQYDILTPKIKAYNERFSTSHETLYDVLTDFDEMHCDAQTLRNSSNSKLMAIIQPNLSKYVNEHTESGKVKSDVLSIAQIICQTDEERQKYETSLQYEASSTIAAINEMSSITLSDPAVADRLISGMQTDFVCDNDMAIAIYNDYVISRGAKPYEKKSTQVSVKCLCGATVYLGAEGFQQKCSVCGEMLYRACPKCKKEVLNAIAVCPHCSFRLSEMDNISVYIQKAQTALATGNIQQAYEFLLRLKEILPGIKDGKTLTDIKSLDEAINQKLADRKTLEKRADSMCDARRYYTVRALVSQQPILSKYVRIAEAQRAIAQAEQMIREAGTNISESQGIKILAICADAAVDLPPPAPVTNIAVTISDGACRVSWSKSGSANTTYRVSRKIGTRPMNESDGDILSEDQTECRFEDTHPPAGRTMYYFVCATRGGKTSSIAVSSVQFIIGELAHLSVSASEDSCILTWEAPAGCTMVRILRSQEQMPIASESTKSFKQLPPVPGSYVDSALKENEYYYYRMQCGYQSGDTMRWSQGLTAVGIPMKRPAPIPFTLSIQNSVTAKWDAVSIHTGFVFARLSDPSVMPSPRAKISDSEFQRFSACVLGETLVNTGECALTELPVGTCMIAGFLRFGSEYIYCGAHSYSSLRPVISASIEKRMSSVYISNVCLAKGATGFIVAFGQDTPPARSNGVRYGADYKEPISFHVPESNHIYFVSLFSEYDTPNQGKEYAQAYTQKIFMLPPARIVCDIAWPSAIARMMNRGTPKMTVSFEPTRECSECPDLVLISAGADERLPTGRHEGTVVLRMQGTQIAREESVDLPNNLPHGAQLRVFVDADNVSGYYVERKRPDGWKVP